MSDMVDTAFEPNRARLFGLAYRMLGSRAEAEDLVQDAYVRWHQSDRASIRNAEAWLVTTATRLALDRLRALKTEREAYTGPWLPEPLKGNAPPSPDSQVELKSDLSVAFLVLLERLAPEERAAFLLHDVFDVDYTEIAKVLDKSEEASRQIVSRARTRVRAERKRFEVSEGAKAALLRRFTEAVQAGDQQSLLALFAPDATWTADGGGRVSAATRPIVGAEQIATAVMGFRHAMHGPAIALELIEVNGETGLAVVRDGRVFAVLAIATDGEHIQDVYAVLNPEKL